MLGHLRQQEVLSILRLRRSRFLQITLKKRGDSIKDIDVVERVPLQVGVVPENEEYIEAKRLVKGHFISK